MTSPPNLLYLPVSYHDLVFLDHALSFFNAATAALNALKSLIRQHLDQASHEAYEAATEEEDHSQATEEDSHSQATVEHYRLRHPCQQIPQRFHPYADEAPSQHHKLGRCRRGGIALREWKQMEQMVGSTCPEASALIGILASGHSDSGLDIEAWSSSLLHVRKNLGSMEDSLSSILQHCASLAHDNAGLNFYLIISQIQLAMKCQR